MDVALRVAALTEAEPQIAKATTRALSPEMATKFRFGDAAQMDFSASPPQGAAEDLQGPMRRLCWRGWARSKPTLIAWRD